MTLRALPFVIAVALLAAPVAAEASLCRLETYTGFVSLGCPLIINLQARDPVVVPTITATRNGIDVPVSVELSRSIRTMLDVDYWDRCGSIAGVSELRREPYDVLELALSGVEPGDRIEIGGLGSAEIRPSGPCGTPYQPWCNGSETVACPADPAGDGAGCNAGGASGLGLGLAIAALLRRRRGALTAAA